jgi:hypothetical protein
MEKDEYLRQRAIKFLEKEDELYNKQNKPKIVDKRDNVVVVSFKPEE